MKNYKLLFITSLLVLGSLLIPHQTDTTTYGSFEEDTVDVLDSKGVELRKGLQIGDSATISVSKTYAQTGTYVEDGVTYRYTVRALLKNNASSYIASEDITVSLKAEEPTVPEETVTDVVEQ